MLTLEKRVEILEKLVNALIKRIDNDKIYQSADTDSERIGIGNNSIGVAENDSAIMDIAELSDENGTAIEELAEMIDGLEERISALEE